MNLILKNRNLLFLFLTGFLKNFLVMIPILTLYFQDRWLTMSEIMILQTIFSILIVILEVPSWYFADYFKRKYSLVLGAIISSIAMVWYYFANSFWDFVIVESLLWVSASLVSWADMAYLYDELLVKKQEKNFTKISGMYESFLRFSEAIWAFLGWFLATFWFKIVILVEMFATFLSIFTSFSLKEHKKNVEKKDKLKMKEVLKFVFKDNDKIKYLILFAAFLGSSTLVFLWLAQPYWKNLWLPLAYFWVFWAILNLLVSAWALFAYKLEKKFSFRQIFILFWIFTFIFYLILYFTNNLYLALIVSSFFWIFRGLNWPIIKDYVNREVESKMRATVLSIKNLAFRIVFSILSPFVWYFADIYNLQIAFLVSATIFFILTWISLLLLIFSYNKKCDICVK